MKTWFRRQGKTTSKSQGYSLGKSSSSRRTSALIIACWATKCLPPRALPSESKECSVQPVLTANKGWWQMNFACLVRSTIRPRTRVSSTSRSSKQRWQGKLIRNRCKPSFYNKRSSRKWSTFRKLLCKWS